jgi:peroxiredoxin
MERAMDRLNTDSRREPRPSVPELPATAALKATQSDRYRPLYDEMALTLDRNGAIVSAPVPGSVFPDFLLPDTGGRLVSRDELLADGPLVIVFLRGAWCPYCRVTMAALQARNSQLRSAGGRLVLVTPEAGGRPLAMKRTLGLEALVLIDIDNGLALAAGLVFSLPDEIRNAYVTDGLDLTERYDNESWFLPVPASFVIDQTGVVRFAHVDPDFRNRPDPETLISCLIGL